MFKPPFKRRARKGDLPSPPPASLPAGDIDLGQLIAILLRQWLFIAFIVCLFVGAGVAYIVVTPKVWVSTARVLLDPRDKQVAGPSVTQPVQGVDLVWIATQSDLVMSADTLNAVIDKENLEKDPELGGDRRTTLIKLSEAINVERVDQTYVLAINVYSHDPERSTRVAQALADSFVASQVKIKAEAAKQASELINRQIDELRSKARDAQVQLEAYRRSHGLISANGRSVDEDTLRQLNDAYVAATVRTRQTKARLDQIEAARKAGDNAGSMLDNLDSQVISRLKIERALAARSLSELAQELGPNHPRMLAAQADLARADADIGTELKTLATAAAGDYRQAVAAEESAKAAVDKAGTVVADAGDANIELRELENEAALRSDLYKSYAARTEEIGLQVNTQVSDARVIVPASTPLYPYAPRKPIILGIAGIAGLGFAMSLALYRGRNTLMTVLAARQVTAVAAPVPQPATVDEGEDLLSARLRMRRPPPQPAVVVEEPPAVVASDAADTKPEIASALPPSEPTEAPLAADKQPSIDPQPEPNAVRTVPVVGRIGLAPRPRDEEGRPLTRNARQMLASAMEDADGNPLKGADEAFGRLLHLLEKNCSGLRRILVLGLNDTPVAAAVSIALACYRRAPDERRLLVDVSCDRLPISEAWLDVPPPGILDMLAGKTESESIAFCPLDDDLTVISAGLDREKDSSASADLAQFTVELGRSFGRVMLHFGYPHSVELLEALVSDVDAVLLVADRIAAEDAETEATILDLADAIPAFTGLVLVGEGRAMTAPSQVEAA